MSNAMIKHSQEPNNARGVVAGVGSAFLPGLGQLINGETDKAVGVAVVAIGAGLLSGIGLPLMGLVYTCTAGYAAIDGFVQGRKK